MKPTNVKKDCSYCGDDMMHEGKDEWTCDNAECPGPSAFTSPKPNFDAVEVCFVLLVKLNVERNHKQDLDERFIRGMMQVGDSTDIVGEKARDRVAGVFELGGFDVRDGECVASIAGIKTKPINIDEQKESAVEERDTIECPKCSDTMFHNGDHWVCDNADCPDGEVDDDDSETFACSTKGIN